jgi:hypothetical protein
MSKNKQPFGQFKKKYANVQKKSGWPVKKKLFLPAGKESSVGPERTGPAFAIIDYKSEVIYHFVSSAKA